MAADLNDTQETVGLTSSIQRKEGKKRKENRKAKFRDSKKVVHCNKLEDDKR